MRSKRFPFIVGGLGVGHVFAWCLSCRRGVVVASLSSTRYNSLPCGKLLGGVFCGCLLVLLRTLIAVARLREVSPNRVFAACRSRLCVAGAIDSHGLAISCCIFRGRGNTTARSICIFLAGATLWTCLDARFAVSALVISRVSGVHKFKKP